MTEPTPPQQPQQPHPHPHSHQPPPAQYAAVPPAPVAPADERTWSVVAHAGGIVTSFVVPLVVWLIYKDRSRRLDDQGKEALNFQLTLLLAYVGIPIVSTVIAVIPIIGLLSVFGMFLVFVAWVGAVVFGILGAMAASRDEWYRYPLTIRFIR
ncbi:hypothetical protein BCE75_10854 [Isoptericola sp. CG 20/1183]|uniref:DUF4870 domain-containing protein n=1 Tax=Isoptericola halotolerans TaxID=300560 RepID=A0ABX5EFZ9_9MICO|nr:MULTISPECIES: DUF4870 domain-containing protein [Isoptericola]MCK0117495.1 DUF4870 domain-containing protein [Isoptericola sp. S6320L]PRZ05076.1 hypothetical protein BCL65_10855 [Isoptericola halotolerans]PRZ05814.1 hypothetical protein BCE75_10854 [Isoptericola sp. CG 20/1183]